MEVLQSNEAPIPDGLIWLTEDHVRSPHRHGPVRGDAANPVSWIWGQRQETVEKDRDIVDFWVKEGMFLFFSVWIRLPTIPPIETITGQRVEYHLANANASRWVEEVNLLEEEMKRTIRYFNYHTEQWRGWANMADAEYGPGYLAHCRRWVLRL